MAMNAGKRKLVMWFNNRILKIPWLEHVSNKEVFFFFLNLIFVTSSFPFVTDLENAMAEFELKENNHP